MTRETGAVSGDLEDVVPSAATASVSARTA